jgi:hypothetical protein
MQPVGHPTQLSAAAVADQFASRWAARTSLYDDSPFLDLAKLSSRTKGAEFERIFDWWATSQGHTCTKARTTNYDRLVDGQRIEIKGSMLWDNGTFRWQQIRTRQDYDILALMAFHPDRLELYGCTRATAHEHLARQDEHGHWPHNQHGGKTVDSGTFLLAGQPSDFAWLQPLDALLAGRCVTPHRPV